MPISQSVSTDVTYICDNPTCRRGLNGPTVVRFNLESVQKEGSFPEDAKKFCNIISSGGKNFAACCPACGAEILGFPQPDLTGPVRKDNVLPFCRKPFGEAIQEHSPINGQEEE